MMSKYFRAIRVNSVFLLLGVLVLPAFSEEALPFFELEKVGLQASHERRHESLHQVKGALYFTREGREPVLIGKRKGFEFEDSQSFETREGSLVLVKWRSPGRGRYLQLDLFLVRETKPTLRRISVPKLPKELYAGEANLSKDGEDLVLEVRDAITGHFYSAPYIYKIFKYSYADGNFKQQAAKYSRPEDATQYINLGLNFLNKKEYERSIHFYIEGLKLQALSKGYIDEPILADVHLNLAKAYVGIGEVGKAKGVLNVLIESYPTTSQAKRAKRIIKKLPSKE
ncbi:hypothetical protein HOF92_01640 [bacterium]|jgi:tetratricopeptide (TPR) repeat protein|nr:hypothetical protein [bacterium]